MAKINLGSSKADYQDALALFTGQEAAVTKNTKAIAGNTGARKATTPVIEAQGTALDLTVKALEQETKLLRANTTAWRAAAKARNEALGASRSLTPTIGPAAGALAPTQVASSDLARFEAQSAAARTSALAQAERSAAADAAAVAAIQAQSRKLLGGASVVGAARPSPVERALVSLEGDPALSGQRAAGAQRVAAIEAAAASAAAARQPLPVYGPSRLREAGADAGLGGFGPAQATKDQEALLATQREVRASLAATDTEVARTAGSWRLYTAETAAASQALTRHGALSTEFIQALARGEITLAEFGTALTSTIGKFAGWAVAGGLVYGAFEALKQVVRGATATATGVAELERVQIPGFDRAQAEEGFRRTGAKLNVSIPDVAEAQFYAARAGFNKNLPETQSAGETALLAFKLDQVPIQEAARGLGAVRSAFGLNATQIRQVFNELDVGQLKFNARLQQTLPYLARSAEAFAAGGGTIQQLTRQIIEVTGQIPGGGGGGGSGSAATFFTREPGNLRKPSSEDILRLYGFDPRSPIGNLNEAIQQAVKRGRAPAGQALEPITPGQQTPLRPAQQGTFRLAEAVSGGAALAGRYGIVLANQAASGRAEEITKALAQSGGASTEDLKAKLSGINEQFASIGHTFERVGSEIGESGAISAGEDFISIIKKIGEATAFVIQPLGQLGNLFSSLPTYLQDIVVAGGGLAATSRLGGFGLLSRGSDVEYVRAAERTTREAAARQKSIIERRSNQLYAGGEREQEIATEKRRFTEAHGRELGPGGLALEDPRRATLSVQGLEIDERLKKQREANVRTQQALVTAHEQLLTIELDEQVIGDRRIQTAQKAAVLKSRGFVGSPGGPGQFLVGPNGEPLGAAYQAHQRGLLGPNGEPLVLPVGSAGGKLSEDLNKAGTSIEAGGAAAAGALNSAGRINIESAASLKEAWALAIRQIKQGGIEIGTAMDAFYAELLAQGGLGAGLRGFRGQVGEGVGSIASGFGLGFGATGSKIGQNALKGFFYAFIGSAISEILGEAISGITGSKGAGSTVSGIGGDVAIGAGIGALFGAPVLGAAVGGLGGILDQSGVFGGGSKGERLKNERLSFEKKKIEEGISANVASVEGQTLEFSRELEASLKDETEGAVKSKEKASAKIKALSATIKVYGPNSEAGKAAREAIAGNYVEAFFAQFQGQNRVAKAAEQFDEVVQAIEKGLDETVKKELPFTLPGSKARSGVISSALNQVGQQRNDLRSKFTSRLKEQGELEDQLPALEKQEGVERAKLLSADRGTPSSQKAYSQSDLQAALAATKAGQEAAKVRARLEEVRVKTNQAGEALGQAEAALASAEIGAVVEPLKGQLATLNKGPASSQEKQGALKDLNDTIKTVIGERKKSLDSIQKEIAQGETTVAGEEARLVYQTIQRSPNAAKTEQAIKQETEKLRILATQFAAIKALLPGLEASLKLVAEEAAFETYQSNVQKVQQQGKLKLYDKGADPAKVRKETEAAEAKEYQEFRKDHPHSKFTPEAALKFDEERAASGKSEANEIDKQAKLEVSRVPRSNKAGRAQAEANATAKILASTKRRRAENKATLEEVEEAETANNNALSSLVESSESESKELVDAQSKLAEAHDVGNPSALARDAITRAQRLLGLAKTPAQRAAAQAELAEGYNKAQEAREKELGEFGALRESTEVEPSQKTATRVATLRKQLAAATNPEQKRKYQADLNNEIIKQAQEAASEKDSQIKFELETHKISNGQAIRELQGLLKRRDLTKATRRQYESEIYKLENEASTDFAVGSIRNAPTLYGAQTLTAGRRIAPVRPLVSGPPRVTGGREQPRSLSFSEIHHPPQLTQHNTIQISIAGKPGEFAHEMESVFGTLTKAQLRSAGLR